MNKAIHDQFLDLACQLSPENLCCDGELPKTEVTKRYRKLIAQWRKLEAKLGRKVTEEEIFMVNFMTKINGNIDK